MACYQLEYDYDIVDVTTEEKKINGKDYTYIIAKMDAVTNKNTVCFVYDEEKGYLMLDDEEKYKNFKKGIDKINNVCYNTYIR